MDYFIGIDPGTKKIGFSIIGFDNGYARLIDCGTYKVKSKERSEQLSESFDFFVKLIGEFNPIRIVVENSFFGKNIKTLVRLTEIKAMAILAGCREKIDIKEITPREVKMALTGNGGTTKEQVAFMVSRLMKCEINGQLDTSDAIAIALCSAIRDGYFRIS